MKMKSDFCMNLMAQGSLGVILGAATLAGLSAASGSVGASIMTKYKHPCDTSELASIGAVGGAVWGGVFGFFNRLNHLTGKDYKINYKTLHLDYIFTQVLVGLIGFAILEPGIDFQKVMSAFILGALILALPYSTVSYSARKTCCPETIEEPLMEIQGVTVIKHNYEDYGSFSPKPE